jgi:hypothetical protein
MQWFILTYLLVLVFLSVNRGKLPSLSASIRPAWTCFTLIPISNFVFALIRTGNINSPRDIALIEIWSNGITSLLLGISLLSLTGVLEPSRAPTVEQR